MSNDPTRRRLVTGSASVLAAGLLGLPSALRAQAGGPRYTVVSEMARELSIVIFQDPIGTRLDANHRQRAQVQEGVVERVALNTTRTAITRTVAGAGVSLVAPLGEDLFPRLNRTAVGDDAEVPADLKDVLAQHRSRQLLVWTRWRSDSAIRGRDTLDLGSGQLEGLGLYVDRLQTLAYDGGRSTTGFIAPYLHARATLVDVASGRVLRLQRVAASRVYTSLDSPRNPGGSIDEAFNADEKVKMMVDLLTAQVDEVTARLVA